jgi:hypothetical protein
VAWPRQKFTLSREDAYRRLLRAGALFSGDVQARFEPGERYSLTTTTGESFTGRVEFVREPRAFCLTVRELNDALLWFTMDGSPRPDRSPGVAVRFLIGSVEGRSLREKMEAALARNLSRLMRRFFSQTKVAGGLGGRKPDK